jgi:hypothetical protein
MEALDEALALVDAATVPYAEANVVLRRLINQAIFERPLIEDDEEPRADFQPLYAELIPLARRLSRDTWPATTRARKSPTRSQVRASCPHKEHDPDSSGPCSHFDKMAERAGFEPAMEREPHTRLAGECLQPLGHLSRWGRVPSLEASRPRRDRPQAQRRSRCANRGPPTSIDPAHLPEGWQSG